MKIGDIVLCTTNVLWTTKDSIGPNKGDEMIVELVKGDYIGFRQYRRYGYNKVYFMKIGNKHFTNELTASLAQQFKDKESQRVETEKNRVFTTNSNF